MLPLAQALPLDEAGKYVAAAYIVFLVLVLVYVAIMAAKLDRMRRDLTEIAELAESRRDHAAAEPDGQASAPAAVAASAQEPRA